MRGPLLGATLLFLSMLFAAPAVGAGDPVRTGGINLQLSSGFKGQLKSRGVSFSPRSLAIKGGAIDPTTGTGSLKLKGKLTLAHGAEKVVLKHLAATVGPGGVLRSRKTKLFRLSGGRVARFGFGATVSGIDAAFLRGAAHKLSRELGLSSPLHRAAAGAMSLSVQPQTLQIIEGTASIDPDLSPGSMNSKLAAHCIDPNSGISAIAPAIQPGGPGTRFSFPVSFGTIGPAATAGVISESGGMQLADGGSGLAPGCSSSNTATIRITDLSADLFNRLVTANVSISGPGSPYGNLNAAISFPLDISDTWVNPDPEALSLLSNGTAIKLDQLAATTLNTFFPQPAPGDPAMEFQDGDRMGSVGLSVRVR